MGGAGPLDPDTVSRPIVGAMVSIGEFARLGRVSVRMLRHYDALGLLPPSAVDPTTGYRSYHVHQLQRLNRITALTSLGFGLDQIGAIVDDRVPPPDLHEVLVLRRTELQAQIAADTARLHGIESRLLAVEDGAVSTHDTATPPFVLKPLEPVRLAQLSVVADIAPSDGSTPVHRLFAELAHRLDLAGLHPVGPRIVHHRVLGGGELEFHAGVVVDDDAVLPGDVEDERLPAVPAAAAIVIVGAVESADADLRTFNWWMHDNGYQLPFDAQVREVYLDHAAGGPAMDVVELQLAMVQAPPHVERAQGDERPGQAAVAPARPSRRWRSSRRGGTERP